MSMIFASKIIEKRIVAKDTLEVSFKRPRNFNYKAGQYIQLGLPKLHHSDYKGASRVLSLVSSPTNQKKLCVAFRNTRSGFKRTLDEIAINATVVVEGPHGFFTLPQHSTVPIVFIAGGIGITPYLSMIRFAMKRHLTIPITLIYVNKSKDRAAYLDELQDMASFSKTFTLKNRFTRINKHFIQQVVKDIRYCNWYITGPTAMVDHARNILFLSDVKDERVLCESFTGYE